jgi:SAM-dependent methyltransferase
MGSDRKELIQSYFSGVAATYAQRSETGWWGWWRKKESKAVLSALELRVESHCLELGCGAGFYGRRIASVNAAYTGVDKNFAMVETARNSGLRVMCEDWEDFNPANKFDRVLAAGLIEFTDNPGELLKKISSFLSPDGIAVLLYPPENLFGALYRCWHQHRGCPVSIVKASRWKSLLSAAGLEIVAQRRVTVLSHLLQLKKSKISS